MSLPLEVNCKKHIVRRVLEVAGEPGLSGRGLA
jgi:hypothetical protein